MSEELKGKNDLAWEKLFDSLDILNKVANEGRFIISSVQINKFREARLMTKFDHKNNLPYLFRKNKLSILPITRGKYIIAPFETYHKIEEKEEDSKVKYVSFPSSIESIDTNSIFSEAIALNAAYDAGIFADFLGEENLLPTISGRMGANTFDFKIKNMKSKELLDIQVKNSQIEIDGGFECMNSLALVEAKNSISSDFLIRQVYYPYRVWGEKLKKDIRNIFFTYSNGIFSLYEYVFSNKDIYNSIKLLQKKEYSIDKDTISFDDIINVYKNTKIVEEPSDIPFPQADYFERIVNLCEKIFEKKKLSDYEITEEYGFAPRQTGYYTNACRYLGLIDKSSSYNREEGKYEIFYTLSKVGLSIMGQSFKKKKLRFAELILQHRPFKKAMDIYLPKKIVPSKEEIIWIMHECNLTNMNETTIDRRASSIRGWIMWIAKLENESS